MILSTSMVCVLVMQLPIIKTGCNAFAKLFQAGMAPCHACMYTFAGQFAAATCGVVSLEKAIDQWLYTATI